MKPLWLCAVWRTLGVWWLTFTHSGSPEGQMFLGSCPLCGDSAIQALWSMVLRLIHDFALDNCKKRDCSQPPRELPVWESHWELLSFQSHFPPCNQHDVLLPGAGKWVRLRINRNWGEFDEIMTLPQPSWPSLPSLVGADGPYHRAMGCSPVSFQVPLKELDPWREVE